MTSIEITWFYVVNVRNCHNCLLRDFSKSKMKSNVSFLWVRILNKITHSESFREIKSRHDHKIYLVKFLRNWRFQKKNKTDSKSNFKMFIKVVDPIKLKFKVKFCVWGHLMAVSTWTFWNFCFANLQYFLCYKKVSKTTFLVFFWGGAGQFYFQIVTTR